MNSSDDDDIIEKELSSQSKIFSDNQSEAEDANDSLSVKNDTSEIETKESEQDTFKGHKKANKIAKGGGATFLKPTENNKKKQQKQKCQNQKKNHRKLVVKQKVLRKRLLVAKRHQKWLQGLAADYNWSLRN